MTRIVKSALVPQSAAQMFALVDDIESYPAFLPWCAGASVLTRTAEAVTASLTLAKGPLHVSFTTENRLQPERGIVMRLVEGPFRRLHGDWRFEPVATGGCTVSLALEFEFASRLLSATVGPLFAQISNSLVDAFRARAQARYGAG